MRTSLLLWVTTSTAFIAVAVGVYHNELRSTHWKNFVKMHNCSIAIKWPANKDVPLGPRSRLTYGVKHGSPKIGYICDDGVLYWANAKEQ